MKRREEFDYVMNKFPDSPRSIVLKTDLLRRGVLMTDEAKRRAADFYASQVTRRSFQWNQENHQTKHETIPIDFYFNDQTHTQLVLGRPENDPYTLDYLEGCFWITSDGERMEEVHFPREGKYVGVMTSTGKPMETVAQRMGSDSLLFVPVGSCGYWRDRDRCKFCHYDFDTARARQADPSYRVELDFQGMYEMTKEALQETGRWRRIMITGGSNPGDDNYQQEFEDNCQIVDAIARAVRETSPEREAGPPIYLIATPQDDVRLEAYKEAGVSAFGFYLETWNAEHFERVCPGKQKYQGRQFFLDQAIKAVDIFGEGNAIAGFVAGIEMAQPPYGFGDMERALESTLGGYEYLIKNRVIPQACLWSIQPGTDFWRLKEKQPPLEFYVRLDRGRLELLREHWQGRLSADAMAYKQQTIGTYCDWQRLLLDDVGGNHG
ncbi:MAG: hypothetical protein CL908_03100 [Deltaproteobacteria bacterium]|nr:hypothetical protein [Deltaproteobacteria bacterium]